LEPACCAAWRAFSAFVLAINNSLVRLARLAEHIPGNSAVNCSPQRPAASFPPAGWII
jgi:hypothetical protein